MATRDHLFGQRAAIGFNDWQRAKARFNDGCVEWNIHDVRRTCATGLQRLGVRLEVTEAILNHVSGTRSGIAGIYQRHEWKEEKQTALARWADHVARIVAEEELNNLVQLRA